MAIRVPFSVAIMSWKATEGSGQLIQIHIAPTLSLLRNATLPRKRCVTSRKTAAKETTLRFEQFEDCSLLLWTFMVLWQKFTIFQKVSNPRENVSCHELKLAFTNISTISILEKTWSEDWWRHLLSIITWNRGSVHELKLSFLTPCQILVEK